MRAIWGAVVAIAIRCPSIGAQALDVRGSWQANLVCLPGAEASVFFQLDQDLDSGAVSSLPPALCGQLAFGGHVPVTSCSTDPAVVTGLVTGTSFLLPASGTFVSDSIVEPFLFGGCPVARVLIEESLAGTITDDGAGRAVAISGALTTVTGQFLRADGSLCLPPSTTLPDCAFEMRRNDVPVGTNVRVAPTPLVSVEFASVTAPGIASVSTTGSTARFPAGFRGYGFGSGVYRWQVATTASVSGPTTVCFHYADTDADGIVDGTEPALDETQLEVIQDAGGYFTARATTRDPIGNSVCGLLPDLGPISFGTPYFPTPTTDRPIAVQRMKLVAELDRNAGRMVLTSKDPSWLAPVVGSADDPQVGTPGGVRVEVFSGPDVYGDRLLDRDSWTRSATGDRWTYFRKGTSSPASKMTLRPGFGITLKLNGTRLLDADGPFGRLAVRIQVGSLRNCTVIEAPSIRRDLPGRFIASKVPAPSLPDCSDETLIDATTP